MASDSVAVSWSYIKSAVLLKIMINYNTITYNCTTARSITIK